MDLFSEEPTESEELELGPGVTLLRGFALRDERGLLNDLNRITEAAPFRHMVTPGGFRMSVAMTNCGPVGWVSDRKGYRYDAIDPVSGEAMAADSRFLPPSSGRGGSCGRIPRVQPGRLPG